eukprot:408359-Lingulodinium_polyedra.AAC.1
MRNHLQLGYHWTSIARHNTAQYSTAEHITILPQTMALTQPHPLNDSIEQNNHAQTSQTTCTCDGGMGNRQRESKGEGGILLH